MNRQLTSSEEALHLDPNGGYEPPGSIESDGSLDVDRNPVVEQHGRPHSPRSVRRVQRRPAAVIRWCFTWNNYPDSLEEFNGRLEACSKLFIYQRERGEQGTPHLQGYVEFKSRQRLTALVGKFPGIHWTPSRGNRDRNVEYCSKNDTRDAGTEPVTHGFPEPIRTITVLRDWQQRCVDLLDQPPHPRQINWYWEDVGNVGKTSLAKYLCAHPKYNAVYMNGKGADIKYFLVKHFQKEPTNRDNLIAIWDLSRTSEDFIPYGSIEAIKNGLFFAGKYESEMAIFNTPHVVVFANYPPDRTKLSDDRWNIIHIVTL